ncbi:MAG: hypothetical protein COB83_03815 [Gammaproteobacteria bacterium]|nr:MAG: hypothetical protein COB83_03815 [Gammaproteobacteria bacterium]
MSPSLQRFFLTIVIYLSVCFFTYVFITPYAFISFIGPAAGITTALVVFWGTSVLLAITVATILFCLFLYFWVNIPIESSLVIITLLTLMLQGFWAKQLTAAEVNQQNWLKSRRKLLTFLFKVGPAISLVSASAVVILTMLENKEYGDNLFFVFISSWSSSVLLAIFCTPLLLLSQGQHQLSLSKRFFITVASLLAVVSISLLFNISQNVQQHQRYDSFNQIKSEVLHKIKHEIALTIEQINSLSAFFKASEYITPNEFNLFSQHVFQNTTSVRVLEWAPVISHENRTEFEKQFTNINEKGEQGTLQIASERSRYAPIKYIYPSLDNEQVLGLDIFKNAKTILDMDTVIRDKGIVASAPINLIQDEHANFGVLFASAIFSRDDNKRQGNEVDLLGFVIAVVQFEDFFKQIAPLKSDNATLYIEDVTTQEPYVLFGKQLNENYRHVESAFLNINSRKWRISLGESEPWQTQTKNWQVWGMLFGITFGGMLFQVLILMMAVYSNELSVQVLRKTRELIIAKEHSEHKNTAKTNFLQSFTNELHTPLQTIGHFTKQLYQAVHQSGNQAQTKIIQEIELAKNNMQKLLSMAADLSKIESGQLAINSEPIDFYGFLERIDAMLKAKTTSPANTIILLIDPSVPHFINSDELKIQQLLIAFCNSVPKLYEVENIRLSIKVYNHQFNSASLLFVFTSHDNKVNSNTEQFLNFIAKDISLCGTEMAMAKEVCQLMGGDANIAISASGERVLTASIKIEITSNEQQQSYQAQTFDEKDNFK